MILRIAGWSVAALALLAAIGIASTRPLGYDLVTYLDAADRLRAGESLYPYAETTPVVFGAGDYLWPPTSVLVFVPLTLLTRDVAIVSWTTLLVALAAGLGVALSRRLTRAVRPWAVAAYVIFLPLIAEITLGNVDLIVLALCLLAWRYRERVAASGATLAAGVGLKPIAALVPFALLAVGAWRSVAAAAAIAALAIAITLPALGTEWVAYLRAAPSVATAPATTVIPLGPTDPTTRVIMAVIALTMALALGRAARDPARSEAAFATVIASAPLAAPAINYPYLVFTLPLLAGLASTPGRIGWVAAISWALMQVPARPDAPHIAFTGYLLALAAGVVVTARARQRRPA